MDQLERRLASLSDEGRYRLLVEAITDYAVYMLDRDGLVASWNPGARRLKGYQAREIVGQHFSALLHRRRSEFRAACAGVGDCPAYRQIRERGLARAEGRHPILGIRRH